VSSIKKKRIISIYRILVKNRERKERGREDMLEEMSNGNG